MSIGQDIKHLRELKKLSQAELSLLTGATPAAICLFEGGKRTPELRTLLAIAKAMDIPLSYLLDDRPRVPTLCQTCKGHGIHWVKQGGGISLRKSEETK